MAKVNPIPEGCHSVQPYMMFEDCGRAMAFYKSAFGAEERMCMRSKDGRVQHAEIRIGDSCVMMAEETPSHEAFAVPHYGGSPITLMLYTENTDAMYARAVKAGGKSLREPADQPYGTRMAGVQDPFGYKWWIGTQIEDMSVEEMQNMVESAS